NKPPAGIVPIPPTLSTTISRNTSAPWPGYLTIKPSPSIDVAEFRKSYKADKALWDKAFAFLNRKDLASLPPGKYPIEGEAVFATISDNASKEFKTSEWESHRKYQDIHYVISGKQKLGIATLDDVAV